MNRTLLAANTADFNDMRLMLTEMEQALIAVEPIRQMHFYESLQNKIYEMLQDAYDQTNILLYPNAAAFPAINYN